MTETKTTTEFLREWDGRAERAAETAREARDAVRKLEGDKPLLAVAATEGDEQARERLAELDAEIADRRKDAEIAETAASESRRMAQDERRLAEEERRIEEANAKRVRYDEIAGKRRELEEAATAAMRNLKGTLDELAKLDLDQRAAAREAGVLDAVNRVPWRVVTNGWIAAHLREHARDLPVRPAFRKPLFELDSMPGRALAPEEKARLAEERGREHAEQRAVAERAFAEDEWRRAVDKRRRELLAQTSHDSSPPAVKRDIERQVEADLAREFPGYVAREEPGYGGPPAQSGGLPGA